MLSVSQLREAPTVEYPNCLSIGGFASTEPCAHRWRPTLVSCDLSGNDSALFPSHSLFLPVCLCMYVSLSLSLRTTFVRAFNTSKQDYCSHIQVITPCFSFRKHFLTVHVCQPFFQAQPHWWWISIKFNPCPPGGKIPFEFEEIRPTDLQLLKGCFVRTLHGQKCVDTNIKSVGTCTLCPCVMRISHTKTTASNMQFPLLWDGFP